MKKLAILSIIVNLLLPTSLVFAQPENTNTNSNEQISETCIFPSTGQKVTIKDQTQTTIQFANCQAQNSQTPSQCDILIKSSQEYQQLLNSNQSQQRTQKLEQTDLTIKACQVSIQDTLKASNKLQESIPKVATTIKNSGACITNDPKIKDINAECNLPANTANSSEQIQSLQLLQNIFNNNFIYQLIDPISDQDLVIQQRTCTYEFIRDKDGLLQVAAGDLDERISLNDSNKSTQQKNDYLSQRQDESFYNSVDFIITENQCYITFVETCQPNLILDATIKFNEELPVSNYCKTYQVIYGTSGTDFIKRFVNVIYNLAVGIVGVIAVIVIIVNGIRISTAGDDSGVISDAKERIAQSLFGLAVLFLAWIILRSINPNFFSSDVEIQNPNEQSQTQEETPNNQS